MAVKKRKAVFLDRDGVINKEKKFVTSWEEFEFIDGIFENIKKLNKFILRIITFSPLQYSKQLK